MSDEIGDIVDSSTKVDPSLYLAAAQAAVRRYCGWHVSPSAEVSGTVSSTGSRLVRLPVMGLSSLDELTAYGEDVLPGARWTDEGLVELTRPVPAGVGAISFRCTAGYDPEEVPDVQTVVVQAARRAAQAPAGSVRSQSVNGASVSYGFTGDGAPMVSLLESERALLAPLRLPRLP